VPPNLFPDDDDPALTDFTISGCNTCHMADRKARLQSRIHVCDEMTVIRVGTEVLKLTEDCGIVLVAKSVHWCIANPAGKNARF
jgi:hypothetical protein